MRRKVTMRPGKGQAVFGGIVGIIFCLIGVFVVIPSAGVFGVFWTLIAAGITAMNFLTGFSEKSSFHPTIEIEDDVRGDEFGPEGYGRGEFGGQQTAWTESENPADTVEERLNRLNDLYDKRLVTQREYEEKRKEILKDL